MNEEIKTIRIDKGALYAVIGVKADTLMDRVITPVLDAGLEGRTYEEKLLKMIQDCDIFPNELAYLGIWGIEAILTAVTKDLQKAQSIGLYENIGGGTDGSNRRN